MANREDLVGKEESILKTLQQDYRIVKRDKIGYVITCDFNLDRLNIEIEKGIITEVTYG